MADDFYALLEVDEDASQDEIKSAFREKVQEYHPDHNDDPRASAQFTALKKAYDTLNDPNERQAYDRMGHLDYVAKRLDGLPDPETWAPSERDDESSDDAETGGSSGSGTATGGRSRSTGTGRSSSRSSTGSSSRSTGTGTSAGTRTGGASGSGRSGSDSTTGTGASATAGTTDSTGGRSAGRSRSTRSSETAGGSAGNHGTGRSAGNRAASDGAGAATRRDAVAAWIANNGVARRLVGWPLLWFAVLLYGAGVGVFGYRFAPETAALADRVAAAGTDTDALAAAFDREALPVVFEFVSASLSDAGAASPIELGAAALIGLGAILLPAITFLLVYLTRGTPGWKPTYLYVLATLGPLAGVVAGGATAVPLAAELALVLALPLVGLFVMLLSAFVRPKLVAALGS